MYQFYVTLASVTPVTSLTKADSPLYSMIMLSDRVTGACTNKIESLWSQLKRKLPATTPRGEGLGLHLKELQYKRDRTTGDLYEAFLQDCAAFDRARRP